MKQKLLSLGIDPSLIKPNSTTSTKSNHGSVWLKNYTITIKDTPFNVVIVGSYSGLELGEDGQRVLTLWEPLGELPEGSIDPLDIVKEIQKGVKEVDSLQKEQKKTVNEQVAREAQKFIEELRSSGYVNAVESPYLKRKKLEPQKNTYIDASGTLIIPMQAERAFIWNYQRITPEGDKYFLAGGRVSGCYHILQSGTSNTIFIGEGYSTCLSVSLAFKEHGKRPTIICGFNSGNLPHVVTAIKILHPNKKIVILADNDQWKERNTGILTAQKCGEAFVTPQFDLESEATLNAKPTDFNDLHCLESLGEVYRQVTSGLGALTEAAKKKNEVVITGEDETEISVARKLVAHYGDSILAHGEDLFMWDTDNGYWRHLEKGNFQRIHQIIVNLFGDAATDKKVRGAFNLFRISISQVDKNIFSQKKHLCNFKNGTLVFDGGKVWLKPHDKRDLLTYSLPLLCPHNVANSPVDGTYLPPPGLFNSLLQRVTDGDAEKILLLKQMYGTALFPEYPQIFFIHGKPKTGKSQIAKVAIHLVGDENCSAVSPTNLFGFNLHDTVGKRVNYDVDVTTRRPLTDDVLKKVIDQMPIQITRKNRDSLRATLPPVHIYVGNELPSLNEGNAKPFERRLSLLKVVAKPIEASEDNKNLAKDIIEKELEHVINFAIAGILSLWASRGEFVQAADKKDALNEWENNSSPEKDFIDLLKTDGVPVYDDDGKATGDRMFLGDGYAPRPLITNAARKIYGLTIKKHLLFKEILEHDVKVGVRGGIRIFQGIEIRKGVTEI
jgi:putative DNA primase/helicase